MKQKWASCSSQGRPTFDRDLLRQAAQSRAKVVVYELLHLKAPSHGPLFRSLQEACLPEYEQAKRTGQSSLARAGSA